MKVSVLGLWHLGAVTAACISDHFHTVGIDPDAQRVANLNAGTAPLHEPGLDDLLKANIASRRLAFSTDPAAVSGCDLLWVTFDTPVDENDVADHDSVQHQMEAVLPHLRAGTIVLISSQVPVGFTARVATKFAAARPDDDVGFAYSPENLRLGKAISVFRHPERIVVGVLREKDKVRLQELLAPISENLLWMSVESAEMTKHALNAFLATSVAFINEIAVICEAVGADAREVERGLKSEARIGPKAYLHAGAAFAGGTLARDIRFLGDVSRERGVAAPLLESVRSSNDLHRQWPARTLEHELGEIRNKTVAVLGLTYKPGTDTLRRSSSVELCRWLLDRGAAVRAYDPKVKELPEDLEEVTLAATTVEAAAGADAAVVATAWPEFAGCAGAIVAAMKSPLVLDAEGTLEQALAQSTRVRYLTVGRRPASS